MWRSCGAYYLLLCIVIGVIRGHDLRNFDDTALYTLTWSEKNSELRESQPNAKPYFITTADNEKYQCFIPDATKPERDHIEPYAGPNPIEILSPLFIQDICSYRIETYWTYELCHGRFVRQYHEDREGKKVKTQQYYLGLMDKTKKLKLSAEYDEREKNPNRKSEIPVKKVDGINMPYVEMEMTNGTDCDLTVKPRTIKVLYVCYQHGKHEIISLKETSSCEYEAIVLSPLLCSHPDYKPQDTGEKEISCWPVNKAPSKPKALVSMAIESLKRRYQEVMDDKMQKIYAILHVDKEGQDGESRVRVEIHPVDALDKQNNAEDSLNILTGDQSVSPAEVSPVQNFLSGKNCLHGGNGWWKYEFCYGRTVVQYHIERDGTKTIVYLGRFDKKSHLEWIAAHPHKKPKAPELRKHLSHFYSDGSICDKTAKLRQTEVKLKCVEDSVSPSSVSLFLLEPKTCEYVLGVESPLICDILEYADENGLLSEIFEVDFGKLRATAFHVGQDDLDERIANGDE